MTPHPDAPLQRSPQRPAGRARAHGGFTLIEVLVALAILAVALGALVKAGSEHTRNTYYLQERTLAHWVGQNLLARYEAGLLVPQRGSREGTLRQADQDWRFEVDVREELPEAELELPPVLRVEVIVWPAEGPAADIRARVVGYLLP
jgi:general secretion pathway protein I